MKGHAGVCSEFFFFCFLEDGKNKARKEKLMGKLKGGNVTVIH